LYRHLIALASAAALFACCGGATAEEGSAPEGTSTGQEGKETVSREDQLGGFELEEMIEDDGGFTGSLVMEGGVGFSDTESGMCQRL
jgi:hypothetical protein